MGSITQKHLKRGTSGTTGRRAWGFTGTLGPLSPWERLLSFPHGAALKRGDLLLQNDDLIPEKLGAPNPFPRLLGLTGESIHGHLHKRVNSRLTIMHLGLCWHHWAENKVREESKGSRLPPCGRRFQGFLSFLLKNKLCFFLILKEFLFNVEIKKIYMKHKEKESLLTWKQWDNVQ